MRFKMTRISWYLTDRKWYQQQCFLSSRVCKIVECVSNLFAYRVDPEKKGEQVSK